MSRRTVLVADDDPLTRQVLSTVLDLEEFQVEPAEDRHRALEQVRALRPAAVVLDQRMPGRTGLEVLTAMRDEEATAGIPVVLLTGVQADELPTDPLGEGVHAHLEKPFSPLHLIELLDELLGGAT